MNLYDSKTVRDQLVLAIAETKGLDPAVADAAIKGQGDDNFQLASKFAEAVIAALERKFGQRLPAPADLQKHEFATVGALLVMVLHALNQSSKKVAS